MKDRERFVATMHYEPVDRPVLWEWGAWGETIRRWQQEGGFEGPPPEYQECDSQENAGVNFGLVPPFERQVIEDDGRTITYINEKGQLLRDFRLRREYGRDLLMTGGIDKRALAAGPEAIETELARCIPVALEGGYIPTVDHSLPPDISYANFQYYWRRKKEMLGIA